MTQLICNRNAAGNYMILSDEHSASSYGQPVLIHNGIAHGPADLLDHGLFGSSPAAYETIDTGSHGPLTSEESDLLAKWRAACDRYQRQN